MKQTVGILLDHDMYLGLPFKRTGYEEIRLYNKAGEQIGIQPFYMSLNHINNKSALGFIFDGTRYRLMKRKIPKVIHNRSMNFTSIGSKTLKQLAQSSIIFNRVNRVSKHKIYNLLLSSPTLRLHLPRTMTFSRLNMQRAMKMMTYSSMFIKPSSGSVGDGIIKLSKQANGTWYLYVNKGKPLKRSSERTLYLLEQYIGNRRYLIQEAIPLATYNGRPYDLRVSVQRGANGEWQITGMVGKVAAAGRHVTNVAKGGQVHRCEELFEASGFQVGAMKQAVSTVSLAIAKFLSKRLPHLADIGLDVGIDQNGTIKLIEMNGRDQRITFKKAKLSTTFYQTYSTPLHYAKYLLSNNESNVMIRNRNSNLMVWRGTT
jgi:hypothetical protein